MMKIKKGSSFMKKIPAISLKKEINTTVKMWRDSQEQGKMTYSGIKQNKWVCCVVSILVALEWK
jgi:hypothetical protein